jgi:transcriptional regulator with PAS, ATPase and Fis domain
MLIGESGVMQELRARIGRVARTGFTVLIEGESGVGKELVARELHARSPRARGPFVALNCAALVDTLIEAELFGIEDRTATGVRGRRGKVELANRGTLFLDEVADLAPTAQAKLLRVLQDMTVERVGGSVAQQVDARVIAATNRSLHDMVTTGRFRADLYYRLAGVEIGVPPLRDRREDVPLLVEHFLSLYSRGTAVSLESAAADALMRYDWPGNVRQLARVIERALALSATPLITLADLPDYIAEERTSGVPVVGGGDSSLRGWSSRYVRLVLDRCDGNKRRACAVLDITYHTLQSHLAYGERHEGRPSRGRRSRDAATAARPRPATCALPAPERPKPSLDLHGTG